MKLTINKEIIRKDNVEFFNCDNCKSDYVIAMSKFCCNCGEPIEWTEDRTAEEIINEMYIIAYEYGVTGSYKGEDAKSYIEKLDSLKQELLNKINK